MANGIDGRGDVEDDDDDDDDDDGGGDGDGDDKKNWRGGSEG